MEYYIIIESDWGLSVAGVSNGESPADVAARQGGVVIDAGPYHHYEDADDAMQNIPVTAEQEAELPESD